MRGKTNPFPSFEYALLGLLYGGPAHGYELHKQISSNSPLGMIWGVKISNLYAQLSKLEKNGFIKGEVHPGEDRPARTEFHLTDSGRQEFTDWLSRMVKHPRDLRQEFMLRYYFVSLLQPASLGELCQRQLAECRQWLANTQEKQKMLEKDSFSNAVTEFRVSQIKSMVDWMQWLITNPPNIKNP
jgi:DNA-binding PadR family transcriptional regulator